MVQASSLEETEEYTLPNILLKDYPSTGAELVTVSVIMGVVSVHPDW